MTKEEILTFVESYKFTISAIEQLNFSISRTMTPDLATAAYTGIHTITCKRRAPDEVNLDKRNKKYAHLFKHLGEKI